MGKYSRVSALLLPFLAVSSAFGLDSPTTPLAPSHVVSHPLSPTSVVIKWADSSQYETAYRVEQSSDGKTFSVVGSLPENSRRFVATELHGDSTYRFRVVAVSPLGESAAGETAVQTSAYFVSLNTLPLHSDDPLAKLSTSPTAFNCRSDGTCAAVVGVYGTGTLCGKSVTDANVVLKINPDRSCAWLTEINPADDLWDAQIAVAPNGDVAALTHRWPDAITKKIVISRFNGANGQIAWTKVKTGTNADGSVQSWTGDAIEFAPASSNLYVAAYHEVTAAGAISGYASIEKYSATGVNTQLFQLTGRSTIAQPKYPYASFSDLLIRADGVIIAVGARSFESASVSREDMLIARWNVGATAPVISNIQAPDPAGETSLSAYAAALDPVDNSTFVIAQNYNYDLIDTQIYKYNAAGSLTAGFPKPAFNGSESGFSEVSAGVDASRRLWISSDVDLTSHTTNGELISTEDAKSFPGGPLAFTADSILEFGSMSPWEYSRSFDWYNTPPIQEESLYVAEYSSSKSVIDQTIAPIAEILSTKFTRFFQSNPFSPGSIKIEAAAADDEPVDYGLVMRFSFNGGAWSSPIEFVETKTFQPAAEPRTIRIQVGDRFHNWSQIFEVVRDGVVKGPDEPIDSGAAQPIDVAID